MKKKKEINELQSNIFLKEEEINEATQYKKLYFEVLNRIISIFLDGNKKNKVKFFFI